MGYKSILGEEECHDDLVSQSTYKCMTLTSQVYMMKVQDFMRHIKRNELTHQIFNDQVDHRRETIENFLHESKQAELKVR